MAIEDPMRALRARLEEVLGKEHALTLIARLPGDEVATKADVEALRADVALRTDLERFATKADLERFATKADLERFATKADLEVMSADLRVAMADGFVAQTRTFMMATIGALITVGGLAVAAAKL